MVDPARDRILARVRAAAATSPAHAQPELATAYTRYPDRRARFITMVEVAAGRIVDATSHDIAAVLAEIPEFRSARSRICEVPGLALDSSCDPCFRSDPDTMLDFAILKGEFGVAENGAIWIDDRRTRDRAVWYLAEHLAVVLDSERIVDTLHDAYADFADDCALDGARFGMFLCGPSKTADIEQALVIGAHGPRTLTVILRRG